jgi:hypothetical protein
MGIIDNMGLAKSTRPEDDAEPDLELVMYTVILVGIRGALLGSAVPTIITRCLAEARMSTLAATLPCACV